MNNKERVVHVPEFLDYKKALKNTIIHTPSVMLNMKFLNKKDIYMPDIKSEDTATWWSILKKGIVAYGIDEVLFYCRIRKDSLSANKFKGLRRAWNLYKRENISYIKKIYCFLCYIVNAIKKRM